MKAKSASQKGTGGMSPKASSQAGSGSRPTGGKFKTPSSAPASAQKLRG